MQYISWKKLRAEEKNFRGKKIMKIKLINFLYMKTRFMYFEYCTDHYFLDFLLPHPFLWVFDFFILKIYETVLVTAPIKFQFF